MTMQLKIRDTVMGRDTKKNSKKISIITAARYSKINLDIVLSWLNIQDLAKKREFQDKTIIVFILTVKIKARDNFSRI